MDEIIDFITNNEAESDNDVDLGDYDFNSDSDWEYEVVPDIKILLMRIVAR